MGVTFARRLRILPGPTWLDGQDRQSFAYLPVRGTLICILCLSYNTVTGGCQVLLIGQSLKKYKDF